MKTITRKEAIEQGLKRYFTGKPCRRGHIAERYVSSRNCTVCAGEQCHEWREDNPDKVKEYSLQYRESNPEKVREGIQRWRRENPEKVSGYKLQWNKSNRERISNHNRKYRELNPEKVREVVRRWRRENPGKKGALNTKYRANKLNRTPPWADLNTIAEVYELAQAMTKITGITYSVDHIIPMQGKLVSGLHVESNLQVMPLIENISKNNKFNPMEYNQPIGMLL